MTKFILYVFLYIIVLFSMDSININSIFKKNKVFQARLFYFIISLVITYALYNLFLEVTTMIKII